MADKLTNCIERGYMSGQEVLFIDKNCDGYVGAGDKIKLVSKEGQTEEQSPSVFLNKIGLNPSQQYNAKGLSRFVDGAWSQTVAALDPRSVIGVNTGGEVEAIQKWCDVSLTKVCKYPAMVQWLKTFLPKAELKARADRFVQIAEAELKDFLAAKTEEYKALIVLNEDEDPNRIRKLEWSLAAAEVLYKASGETPEKFGEAKNNFLRYQQSKQEIGGDVEKQGERISELAREADGNLHALIFGKSCASGMENSVGNGLVIDSYLFEEVSENLKNEARRQELQTSLKKLNAALASFKKQYPQLLKAYGEMNRDIDNNVRYRFFDSFNRYFFLQDSLRARRTVICNTEGMDNCPLLKSNRELAVGPLVELVRGD